MKPHYIAVADQAHLRIFAEHRDLGQMTPGLDEVYALDFPQEKGGHVTDVTKIAGHFQGDAQEVSSPDAPDAHEGTANGTHPPLRRGMGRRNIHDIADALGAFLINHPHASWDFAAGPSAHNAILERLPAALHESLHRSLSKDLVKQPTDELLARFESAA